MVRPMEMVAPGLSRAKVYQIARRLNLSKPYKFTPAEVRRILAEAKKGKK